MPLQKQTQNINFSQGLDTKTDPKQVTPGKFLALQNTVFNKGGQLQKRNGFGSLTTLSATDLSTLTTFNGNLAVLGKSIYAYSADSEQWINKGSISTAGVSTQALVRTSSAQTGVDVAVTSLGLTCTVWADSDTFNYYQVTDSTTGQVIVAQTALATGSSTPRVFLVGNFFVITYLQVIGTTHLRYIAIPTNNLTSVTSPVDLSTVVNTINAAYDGQVIDEKVYLAFDASDVGGAIRITSLNRNLTQQTTVAIASQNASKLSVTGDNTQVSPRVWISWVDSTDDGYTAAYNVGLIQLLAPTAVWTGIPIQNLTSSAQNNVNYIYYEVINTYSYSSVRTDYLATKSVTIAGVVSSQSIIIRSLGLASKSFIIDSVIYMLTAYNGAYQPTYFLIDSAGNKLAKLAYSNGGGYPSTQVLSNVAVYDLIAQIGYLFKGQVVAVNKTQNVDTVGGLYGQLGVNLVTFNLDPAIQSVEIAGSLHLNGGYLRQYDGVSIVEHGFHLWPEDLGSTTATTGGGLSAQEYFYQATYEWTDANGNIHRSAPSVSYKVDLSTATGTAVTFTSVFTTGATTLTVSSVAGLHVGQVITDNTTGANLTPGTIITAINGLVLTLNQPTAGNSAAGPGDTLQTVDTLSATIKVPTLRVTSKVGNNKVRIVLYRWSTAQQNFYQTTSITSPTLNDTTIDSVSIVDNNNDAEILGNPLIYTTGGVIENIAAPACNAMTLYKSRLFLIDAEDQNLLWYSKQVIENTPVEMSDLFTQYVAPTISASGSTGPAKALFAMDDKLVIFKADAIYYGVGNGPDNTGANNDFSEPVFITSTVGCSNQASLVFMPNGIMFQSDKGLWLLGRDLSTSYIGAGVEEFNSNTVLSGLTVPATNQVRFTLNNNVTLMYDYYYQQWGSFYGAPAISSTIYQGLHTILDSYGRISQETPGVYLDGGIPVSMFFKTGWMNLAGLQGYERAYFFYLLGQYITPHKLQVQIAYDYDPSLKQTSVISPDNYSAPYGGDTLYGSSSPYGGPSGVEQWRVFLQQQKCQAFQITLTEVFDSTFGVAAGAGLTLSGIDLVMGIKSGYPRLAPAKSVG